MKLNRFLEGLKSLTSEELIEFLATNAELIDASGKRWTVEEISKRFEALFASYAKKNASYVVEATLIETHEVFIAGVLWKNALLASEERRWMHRMSVVFVSEANDWKIQLVHVPVVQSSPPFPKGTE